MASSPEMEPPGFEHVLAPPPPLPLSPPPSPPLSESPDEAPPGFDTPNAWAPVSGTGSGTCDPPPTHNQSTAALPSPEPEISPPPADGTGNGMCNDFQMHEEPSIGEETVGPPMPDEGFHGAHTLGLRMAQTQVPVPMEGESIDPVQTGSAMSVSDTVCLEPLPEPTKSETLIESRILGQGASSEQISSEVCYKPDTRIKEENNNPVLKPELVPPEEAISKSQAMQVPSVLVSLPAQPIPVILESVVPESNCENLDPVMMMPPPPPPPPPPPALIVHDTPKSPVLKSECDNLNQNASDRGLIGNNISSEHEAVAPAQPPLNLHEPNVPDPAMLPLIPETTELRHDNQQFPEEKAQNPPNQENMMFPCSPIIQITDEPPPKSSQTQNTYEIQAQSTMEECQSDDDDLFESVTPERDPRQDDDMEQVDMDMSDDDACDRSPTHVGPHGSGTGDLVSPEEALPGYSASYATDQSSQMGMISQNAFSGTGQMVCGNCHELISYPQGALHVLCTCCQTINLVLQACQVGNVTCGQCSVLLMYPFGAPSVRCSCCRYVTEIGVHNMRPPLSVQRGDSHPTLECQLTAS